MIFDTAELGPRLGMSAPEFKLPDHSRVAHTLDQIMGESGLLLGFIGDIWQPTSVQRILWLQRHIAKFARLGTPAALMVRDQPNTLYGFRMSSPLPVPFPMLADVDGAMHAAYRMSFSPGLLLIDTDRTIRYKWLMPDDTLWPPVPEIVQAVQTLQTVSALQ